LLTRVTPAQSYSAELIVHPSLRESQELTGTASDAALAKACDVVASWLPRLDALVVGPGLGRDESVLKVAEAVVRAQLLHPLAAQRTRR
jgi:ATP-dependent NAD(P)H-hydrate dehydratase